MLRILGLVALLALPCLSLDVNQFEVEGVVLRSEPLASNPDGSWLLLLATSIQPGADGLTSLVCPLEPGFPGLEDTYDECSRLRQLSRARLSGVLLGFPDGEGLTRAYVTKIHKEKLEEENGKD